MTRRKSSPHKADKTKQQDRVLKPDKVDVRRIEAALPPALFRRVLRGVKALGDKRLAQSYRTTFWFDFRSPPSSLVEEAALVLRRHVPDGAGLVGCEWWLSRMRTSNVQVDFHLDRDEHLALQTGRQVHPTYSSVLFLNRCRGGLLAITAEPPCEENPACAPEVLDFELIRPEPNRYALFSGRLTHGVLDARGEIPGRRLPRETGLRLAIALNYWTHRPREVPRFSERRVYSPLKC